jgi:cytidine deaminase
VPEKSESPELFIAIVTPIGARREDLRTGIERALHSVGYTAEHIRLSKLLERCKTIWSPTSEMGEGGRIRHLQKMGNTLREKLNDGAALARAATVAIRERRQANTGDPDKPATRTAYVLDQLKHPDEVDFLREMYGSCFFLIAGHAPERTRQAALVADLAKSAGQAGDSTKFVPDAHGLIQHDLNEEGERGQNTRDTYPKADLFVNLAIEGLAGQEIERFVELLFGHPFHTPTRAEYALYQASAASHRSSDDSRQVGAAIAIAAGDVIAVGANEVPHKGGGLYWGGESPDARDQALARRGDHRAADIKESALCELMDRMDDQGMLVKNETKSTIERARALIPFLKGTQFLNIGEFSRPVHAEMAALIDAARRGVSVDGNDLYVTTFPCHNCAKHIIAAGIKRVVYLEPYPKSRARFLHGEEIDLDPEPGREDRHRVVFSAYSGIAPPQYHQLFGMNDRGNKKGLPLAKWEAQRRGLSPRHIVRNASDGYLAAERDQIARLPKEHFE